jgi:hypothetical protein
MFKVHRNARLSDPLIVDREFDLFFLCAWLVYMGWGISAAIAGVPTITLVQGGVYNLIWAISLSVTALMCALSCLGIFYATGYVKAITKKKIELGFAYLLTGIVSVYPAFVWIQALAGDETRVATSFVSLLYILIPVYRIRHLTRRIRYYESVSHAN